MSRSPSGIPENLFGTASPSSGTPFRFRTRRQSSTRVRDIQSSLRVLAAPRGDIFPQTPDPLPFGHVLTKVLSDDLSNDPKELKRQIAQHVKYTLGRTRYNFDSSTAYQALAYTVHDRLIERWNKTQEMISLRPFRRVYYLSMEYLIGRSLRNAIMNLGLRDVFSEAVNALGYRMEDLYDKERDAALGNGGLGRLAACFMDSAATLDLPVWGYGLRYNYGMFEQQIRDGWQMEFPDYWLSGGNPWEIERMDLNYQIGFGGEITETEEDGFVKKKWEPSDKIFAVAYDLPVPGYKTFTCLNIRLWSAKPSRLFDLASFNAGDYFRAVEQRSESENLTAVLYPNDITEQGKLLRLKQEYFFSSASVQDIVRRFKRMNKKWKELPEFVCVQLNDTHPAMAILELMRILVDVEGFAFQEAWEMTKHVFAFTNHTVLPEALEKWSVDLMEVVLPRHMDIIYELNWYFLNSCVKKAFPGDIERIRTLSLIEEGVNQNVRMANLCILGSFSVNGVAEIHTELIKTSVFRYFYELFPKKFNNKTNGVTPRRWVMQCNPYLGNIYYRWIGSDEWLLDMSLLRGLESEVDNPDFQNSWKRMKRTCKNNLAVYIKKVCGVSVNVEGIFDIHVKRIHEYKRQYMNILSVIERYMRIKNSTAEERKNIIPRTVVFSGKAAPGYSVAKRIIKLITSVADTINADKNVNELLKVVFIPDYNVSVAELIIPAADVSQHISLAGTEASGTSNMKFAMNGALIIGTLDGANVEIRREIGEENTIVFGLKADEVSEARGRLYRGEIPLDSRLNACMQMIDSGTFGKSDDFACLVESIMKPNDNYLVQVDFPAYLEAQQRVDDLYRDENKWTKMSILSGLRSAFFSSDRSIEQYAQEIWRVKAVRTKIPAS